MVFTHDNVKVGQTDINGNFKVNNTVRVKSLVFEGVGMETIQLSLNDSCDRLELVMLYRATYDFISLKKADKLRKKEFNKLPEFRRKAFESGVFVSDKVCFKQDFLQ